MLWFQSLLTRCFLSTLACVRSGWPIRSDRRQEPYPKPNPNQANDVGWRGKTMESGGSPRASLLSLTLVIPS